MTLRGGAGRGGGEGTWDPSGAYPWKSIPLSLQYLRSAVCARGRMSLSDSRFKGHLGPASREIKKKRSVNSTEAALSISTRGCSTTYLGTRSVASKRFSFKLNPICCHCCAIPLEKDGLVFAVSPQCSLRQGADVFVRL